MIVSIRYTYNDTDTIENVTLVIDLYKLNSGWCIPPILCILF